MEISEIRIKLVAESDDRLRGFCSITFREGFVIRDLRIIEGESGLTVPVAKPKTTSKLAFVTTVAFGFLRGVCQLTRRGDRDCMRTLPIL
jgi:hypothetical protein